MRNRVPDHWLLRTTRRQNGYAPIQDYAVIGNKRTAALVALDGSIDWLCLPRFDEPTVFGALLDPAIGGRFALAPAGAFEVERRYVSDTNVLETTFATSEGKVRVTDFMSIGEARPVPWNELVRHIEGVSGSVTMQWRVEPRFEYDGTQPAISRAGDALLLSHGDLVLALQTWDAGDVTVA